IVPENLRPDNCAGRYADSFRNVRQLVYSFSTKDSVLYKWFGTKEWYAPIDEKECLPVMDGSFLGRGAVRSTALGSPFNLEALEAFPKVKHPWENGRHLL